MSGGEGELYETGCARTDDRGGWEDKGMWIVRAGPVNNGFTIKSDRTSSSLLLKATHQFKSTTAKANQEGSERRKRVKTRDGQDCK